MRKFIVAGPLHHRASHLNVGSVVHDGERRVWHRQPGPASQVKKVLRTYIPFPRDGQDRRGIRRACGGSAVG